MAKIAIIYFSHGGNTRRLAEALDLGLKAQNLEVDLLKAGEASVSSLPSYDGILLGSPCYFGIMAAEVKDLIDRSIKLFGKGELMGKPGGVFCSTGGIGGGGELTLISLLAGLLIHGMVVQGLRKGGHFGPLAIGAPDERVLEECRRYAEQFAALTNRLAG